ncbi:MAG: hypothetical protein ACTHJ0_06555 [Flavipsychrobacter sp.]
MRKHVYQILPILLFGFKSGGAQTTDSIAGNIENVPASFLAKIQRKYPSIESDLSKKTARYLHKMEPQEKRLQRKALKAHSGYVRHENIDSVYTAFRSKLSASDSSVVDGQSSVVHLNQCNPFIDTLSASLIFLRKYNMQKSTYYSKAKIWLPYAFHECFYSKNFYSHYLNYKI